VLLICFAVILGVLLRQNAWIFSVPFIEQGDQAANSILAEQAKHFTLLVGNYSRVGFNHPGPAFFYVQGFSDVFFHELLGLFPADFNAQLFGVFILDAFLIATGLVIIACNLNSGRSGIIALAVILLCVGMLPRLHSGFNIGNTWMPDAYFAPYFLFVIVNASILNGNLRHAPLLVLAGGLLVHGHVSFVLPVVVCTLFTVLVFIFLHWAELARRIATARLQLLVAVLILAIFLLPIALNVILFYPGEIPKYVNFAHAQSLKSPRQILHFISWFWTGHSPKAMLAVASVLLGYIFLFFLEPERSRRSYMVSLAASCIVATLCLAIYAARGVDDLELTYVGYFYFSVPILLLSIVCVQIDSHLRKTGVGSVVVSAIAATAVIYAAAEGNFANEEPRQPGLLAATQALIGNPLTRGRTVILGYDTAHNIDWGDATGLMVAMYRAGGSICVPDARWTFLFSRQFICSAEQKKQGIEISEIRANSSGGVSPGAIYRSPDTEGGWALVPSRSLRQYTPGEDIDFSKYGNSGTIGTPGWRYAREGWADAEDEFTWSIGERACLDLSFSATDDEPLTMSAQVEAFVVPQHPLQRAEIVVNGRSVGTWTFQPDAVAHRSAQIPAEALAGPENRICFLTPAAASPSQLGLGNDDRKLALKFYALNISPGNGSTATRAKIAQEDNSVSFSAASHTAAFRSEGWSNAEEEGTWTDGPLAALTARLPRWDGDMVLSVTARPFLVPDKHPDLKVKVLANGTAVGQWSYDVKVDSGTVTRTAQIPAAILASSKLLAVEFRIEQPATPTALGVHPSDSRSLGLFVHQVSFLHEGSTKPE
jgi:hypothetical protein